MSDKSDTLDKVSRSPLRVKKSFLRSRMNLETRIEVKLNAEISIAPTKSIRNTNFSVAGGANRTRFIFQSASVSLSHCYDLG